jgi:hypothetical protein
MNIIVYIAKYLLSSASITMSLHTTLSSSGIQEQISPAGKCSPANLVCAQPIMHAMFKCSYMNHSHHTLPALLDIIMEAFIVDLSREVMHGHKVFHTERTPDWLSFANANSITTDNYVILVQSLMVKLTKKESNST